MTKTIIFAITILTTILILGTSIVQAADHGDAPLMSNDYGAGALAIPGWVDNNFKWYGEGKISQSDLLNGIKHLMDNNLMHISDKAAEEVQNLREENRMLKQKIGVDPEDPDIILRPVPGALPELPGLPDGCPEIYAPVCGRDGRTYPNKCFADDAGVGIFHDGECRDIPHRECPSGYTWIQCAGICVPHGDDYVCPDEYKWNEHAGQCTPDMDKCICTKEYNPVCGTDGKTYGNKCVANCENAQIEYEGECRDECSSNLDCKGDLVCRDGACLVPCNIQCIQYDPVCGTDGNTYGCGMPDAQCHGVEVAHDGECSDECSSNADCSGSDVCRDEICQAACSVQCIVPDPVCGEDGITYVCGEADAACHGVEVSHEGECIVLRVTPAQ